MNIQLRDGLLFTSIQLTFQGITKTIENVVIDLKSLTISVNE